MKKIFEDYFSELQADMVSICLEYVDNKADMIYIYCSCEANAVSSDFFFCINGATIERHKLNSVYSNTAYDVSAEKQDAVLQIINEDIEKIMKLCKQYEREMPTEMKIIYNVKRNSLVANYKYDLTYSNEPQKTSDDIAFEWFEQIKKETE